MTNLKKTILLSSALFLFLPASICAQEEEDFERLARRSIDSYESELKKIQAGYDSATWHGAAYVGVSSRGHILPNGFFNYKKGKVRMKGEVLMDFSDLVTERDEEGFYATGDHQTSSTQMAKKYEHEDLTFRLDYLLDKQNTLSFDFFQKYYSDRVGETATLYKDFANGDGTSKYEEQQRDKHDFNFGTLLEYLHNFNAGGSLSARVYMKYDNTPTDIYSEVWGNTVDLVENTDHQALRSKDTKAQLLYHSPKWNGFNFSVREKVGKMNTRISDAITMFDYDVMQTLTSGALNYKVANWTFLVEGGLETFHHDIQTLEGGAERDVDHTYYNKIYDAKATWKMNQRNSLVLSFKHDVNRPTYTQLYPYIHVGSNIGSRVIGNENLEPSTTNEVKTTYTYSIPNLKLNTILTYQKKNDEITSIAIYDEASQMNVKTWVNDADYNTLKAAVEGEVKSGIFEMTFGARVQRLWYEGEHVKSDKAWSYSFKTRPRVNLPNQWQLSAVVLYNGREEHLYWYNRAFTYFALRAQKQIGDWAVYAFMQDILNPKRVKNEFSKGNSILTSNNYNARALILGCSYRF